MRTTANWRRTLGWYSINTLPSTQRPRRRRRPRNERRAIYDFPPPPQPSRRRKVYASRRYRILQLDRDFTDLTDTWRAKQPGNNGLGAAGIGNQGAEGVTALANGAQARTAEADNVDYLQDCRPTDLDWQRRGHQRGRGDRECGQGVQPAGHEVDGDPAPVRAAARGLH